MTIQEIMFQIVEGNNMFTGLHTHEYFESFKAEQRPFITLVSCSDSRVTLNALMSDTSNKIFSVQNIGNQVLSNEGSIDYGIYHLKTPLLLVLGHSDCGAIKTCLRGYDLESNGIKHELSHLTPLINDPVSESDFAKLHTSVIEKNLDYQVNIACNKYNDLIMTDELNVIGAYYDFKGDFGKGQGTIVIVNINNCKDVEIMYTLPAVADLTQEQKELHIDRLQ